jgi:PAS domain S-box-containing protein
LKAAVKISVIYLACGLAWILLSDRLAVALAGPNKNLLEDLQTYKGFFFVGFTALMLYFLTISFYTEIARKLTALEESERRYVDLFRLSPLPLWVFDVNTLRFLAVNDAAIRQYGFSREEFLAMTIKDIRRDEDVPKLMETIESANNEGKFVFRGVFTHKKKNGDLITVEIRSNDVSYRGASAKVVLVNDITQRMNYISAIEERNRKLQEIAWMQSHIVRAPLATMMGLIQLLKAENTRIDEKEEIIDKIIISATDFDEVIRQITEKTNATAIPVEQPEGVTTYTAES